MSLSRRAFLTLTGATALAAVPYPIGVETVSSSHLAFGRVLRRAAIRRHPNPDALIVRVLWPDEVVLLEGITGGWYAVPGGYVPARDVQPFHEDPTRTEPASFPAYITAAAPVAAIRQWADDAAPVCARIGCGGVLRVLDRLTDEADTVWYAVEVAPDEPPGWTLAQDWSAVCQSAPDRIGHGRVLRLDSRRAEWIAWEEGRAVLRAPVAVPAGARRGAWAILDRLPTVAGAAGEHPGAAWVLHGAGGMLYGAYWHNDFGAQGTGPGWEAPPLLARWLYGWLPEGAAIEVA